MADSKGVQYSPTGFEDDSLASTLLREVHSLSGGDGDGESDGFRLEAAGTVSVAQVSADTGDTHTWSERTSRHQAGHQLRRERSSGEKGDPATRLRIRSVSGPSANSAIQFQEIVENSVAS